MYIEHLERKAVNDMTSHTQLELYMSAINPHTAKALRTNIHYGSRYAATSVGDAMKKAEECYLKDLYARAGLEKDRDQGMADGEVTRAKISTRGRKSMAVRWRITENLDITRKSREQKQVGVLEII